MRLRKGVISLLTVLTMLVSIMSVAAFAENAAPTSNGNATFTDMPSDWSATALKNAVANGLLNGSNGKIMPKDSLTRVQMAAIIVRAFGATVKGSLNGFSDVSSSDWFADSIAIAYNMGVIKGFAGEMNPNDPITRQEAFVILARALKLSPAQAVNTAFSDVNNISGWAKGEVFALINAGYVKGAGGKLNPQGLITRAEFAQVMDNIIKQYISVAGTYTSVSSGNVMVNVPGVTLKGLTVSGDLIVGDGVGDGELTLDSVNVSGRMVIRGGGVNSIIIKGSSSVSTVIITRVDGVVSVKVEGGADVEVIYVDDGCDDVNIEGTVGSINVEASGITVNAVGATIDNIGITGDNSTVKIDSKSSVKTISIKQDADNSKIVVAGKVETISNQGDGTQISGTGAVKTVQVQSGASNVSIETPNTVIIVESGASGVTGGGGSIIASGTTQTNNGTGTGIVTTGGGYAPPILIVTSVSVTNATAVTIVSPISGVSFKIGTVLLTSVESGTGPYSYSVTIPVSSALQVGATNITAYKSEYISAEAVANYSGTAVTGSIQAAIHAATAGDTLLVSAGTYAVNLLIDKALTLKGADKTTTILSGAVPGVVVKISASYVTLSGFTVRNSGEDISSCAGIVIAGSSALATNVSISGNIISGNATGVALMGASGCTVSDNTISNNKRYGIVLEVSPYNPALFSTLNTISGNAMTANDRDGIYVGKDCNTNTITHNSISGALGTTESGSFEANGIYLWKSAGNTITDNTISNNAVGYGIEIYGSSSNTITGNTITQNRDGLHIRNINETINPGYSIRNNTITLNKIYGNTRVNLYASPNFEFSVENNWWGSDNVTAVADTIASWDASGGVVRGTTVYIDFLPICTNEACTRFSKVVLTQNGSPNTYAVYPSITTAIAAASDGDRIDVSAGVYKENITIDKSLTIDGENKTSTILDGSRTGVVVTISASNVTLSGFTIKNSGTDINTCAGVGIIGASALATNVTISDNIITGNATGVALMGASSCTVNDNNISDNARYGIVLEVSPYSASRVSTSNTISGNTLTANDRDGIYIGKDCNTNTITDNSISGALGTTEGSNFEANGIYLWKSAGNTIIDNTIANNAEGYGIEMYGSSGNTITGNTVTENLDGLHIRNIDDPSYSIRNNTISLNNVFGNTRVNLYADPNFTFNVENNWWGSNVESEIVAKMASWDSRVGVYPGTTVNIDYSPWASSKFS